LRNLSDPGFLLIFFAGKTCLYKKTGAFAAHFAKLAQKKLEKKIASQKESRSELLEFNKVVGKAVVL
jgi:hypothetical protein